MKDKITSIYRERFGSDPQFIVRAPGRVNLIGEHTDYNDGFVMPMAINRATWIALSPTTDNYMDLYSADHDASMRVDLNQIEKQEMSWREYPKGVAWSLKEAGYALKGWQGVTICDIPMGAGLSSSASYELAIARAFYAVSDWEWDATRMALLGQKAENQWVGVNCGIMDQMISSSGREGMALLIDCRDLSTRAVPLPHGTLAVIMDTATRRGLVDSAYNERRQQCEEAARFFKVKALRDVSIEQFEAGADGLPPVTRKRAKHVITENDRTVQAANVMEQGDADALGLLLDASHNSLRDDFEVTNQALDDIVQIARRTPGCIGARMTGAGFGGCAVALVHADRADAFIAVVEQEYKQKTALTPFIYACVATNGAELVA